MKKQIQHLLLILISITHVSCFEIVEHLYLNNDGSGTFKYVINFNQSATKIKSLLLLDEVEGYKVPTFAIIKTKFNAYGDFAKTVKGVTNLKTESNFNDFIFTYSFNFTDINQINSVIDTISKTSFPTIIHTANYFNYNQKEMILKRTGDDILKNSYVKLPENQRAIFNGAMYTSIYKFEGQIINQTNSKALVSANKKAIFHKTNVSYIIKDGRIINKKIYLKK